MILDIFEKAQPVANYFYVTQILACVIPSDYQGDEENQNVPVSTNVEELGNVENIFDAPPVEQARIDGAFPRRSLIQRPVDAHYEVSLQTLNLSNKKILVPYTENDNFITLFRCQRGNKIKIKSVKPDQYFYGEIVQMEMFKAIDLESIKEDFYLKGGTIEINFIDAAQNLNAVEFLCFDINEEFEHHPNFLSAFTTEQKKDFIGVLFQSTEVSLFMCALKTFSIEYNLWLKCLKQLNIRISLYRYLYWGERVGREYVTGRKLTNFVIKYYSIEGKSTDEINLLIEPEQSPSGLLKVLPLDRKIRPKSHDYNPEYKFTGKFK